LQLGRQAIAMQLNPQHQEFKKPKKL